MSTGLRIDAGDPAPPYEQIVVQVVGHIAAGRLAEGDRMPPVRQLAGDLGLAVGTVARAYRELEGRGILRTRRGGGTTVAQGAVAAVSAGPVAPTVADGREQPVPAGVVSAIAAARARGVADAVIERAVGQVLSGLSGP